MPSRSADLRLLPLTAEGGSGLGGASFNLPQISKAELLCCRVQNRGRTSLQSGCGGVAGCIPSPSASKGRERSVFASQEGTGWSGGSPSAPNLTAPLHPAPTPPSKLGEQCSGRCFAAQVPRARATVIWHEVSSREVCPAARDRARTRHACPRVYPPRSC